MMASSPVTSNRSGNHVARQLTGYGWVLHEKGQREYHWEGEGWLSIKSFYGGTAFYEAGQGHFAVDEHHYLVLNHGRSYSITLDSEAPMESFCVFFRPGLAADVHRNQSSSHASL